MRQRGSLTIYHIIAQTIYYDTCDLFSITKSQIYNKDKHDPVKLFLLYKSTMESNTFLFDTNVPKIGNIQVVYAQVAYTYVQLVPQ